MSDKKGEPIGPTRSIARELLQRHTQDKKDSDLDVREIAAWLRRELRQRARKGNGRFKQEIKRLEFFGYVRESSDFLSGLTLPETGQQELALQFGLGQEVQGVVPIGRGKWRKTLLLGQLEFNLQYKRVAAMANGHAKTLQAMDAIKVMCDPIWEEHPDFSVAECLRHVRDSQDGAA